jgi:hypothetical protein
MKQQLSRLLLFALGVLFFLSVSCHANLTDKATGIKFAPTFKDLTLFGVGVRKKGPIKVYSVGMYCSESLKEKLSTMSKSGKEALQTLRNGAKETPTTFLLEMNFKVGAEKMANAIAESVTPRYKGKSSDVDDLKSLITTGVGANGSVGKGNKLRFDCLGDAVAVAVDGKDQGKVSSKGLSEAMCDVYLDDKCVSPTMRESCLNECCMP